MGMIYGEYGSDGQMETDDVVSNPPAGYGESLTKKPPGFYIFQDDGGGLGTWVDGMTSSQAKLNGILIDDVMCSATGGDQDGLTAMYILVKLNGGSSDFYFENGNKLNLSPSNFDAFYSVWVPFRQSFYE